MQNLDSLIKASKRPICFLKVHTTGTNFQKDKIVQITIHKIGVNGQTQKGTRLINPGVSIPEEATKINGITDEKVKDSPKFSEVADKLYEFVKDSDFCGFHVEFDLKFLIEEFNKSGKELLIHGKNIIDISSIYNSMESRDFKSAINFYLNEPCKLDTIGTEEYTENMIKIFDGILNKYSEKKYESKNGQSLEFNKTSIEEMNNVFNRNKEFVDISGFIVLNEDKRSVFNMGKHKGDLVSEVVINNTNYYDWIVNVSDMPADTKIIIKKIREKALSIAQPK